MPISPKRHTARINFTSAQNTSLHTPKNEGHAIAKKHSGAAPAFNPDARCFNNAPSFLNFRNSAQQVSPASAWASQLSTPKNQALDCLPLSKFLRAFAQNLLHRWQFNPAVLNNLRIELECWAEFDTAHTDTENRLCAKLIACTPPGETSGHKPFGELRVAVVLADTDDDKTALNAPMNALRIALQQTPDLIIAPEWYFSKKGEGVFEHAEMLNIVGQLCTLSRDSDTLLVPGTIRWKDDSGHYYNTALAISGGKILKRYDKRNDGGERDFARKRSLVWVPGRQGSLFNWRDRTVALEICRDHGDALARRDAAVADLHLVVSAGVRAQFPCTARGGVFVLAQGDPIWERAEVFRRPLDKNLQHGNFFEKGELVYKKGAAIQTEKIDEEISLKLLRV